MTAILCPYCKKHSHVTFRWGQTYAEGARVRVAATCDHCGRLSVGESIDPHQAAGERIDTGAAERAWERGGLRGSWLPLAAESPEIEDVPPHIVLAAKEAHTSMAIGNYMSAILMARTVIEATAKANEITKGDLSKKINEMRDKQLIRPAIADQAHEVRYFGNDMAHGDIEDVPERIDAEEVLALMGQVLNEVFQGPAVMRRLRARREAGDQQ